MLDIELLRILKHRKEYTRLRPSIPDAALDIKTKAVLDDFGKYFEKFPDEHIIRYVSFLPRFRQWHPTITEESMKAYDAILRQIDQEPLPSTKDAILADLYELQLGNDIGRAMMAFDEGTLEMPLSDVVGAALDAYKIQAGIKLVPWNDTPIEDLLLEDMNNEGLRWRLNCLNESMRPLRAGDFGIVAARPDQGKTTFLASEVSYMAAQMQPDQNVVWLNNEGTSGKIMKRIYQAVMGKTITEMVQLAQEDGNIIREAYKAALGRLDRIRVIDAHGYHIGQVEAILEQSNPGLVVFDMIDNIKGFGSEARTDLQLEAMYQWARERMVKYNCVGLATSQISADGDNTMFPGLSMLKDSKTGKQGACDFQLMIGSVDDPNFANSRFISLPKNKLHIDSGPKSPNAEVAYKPRIARFTDIPIGDALHE